MSKSTESPVCPCPIRYLNRLLVSSPVPNPAIWRIVFLVEITVVDHALGLEFRARQLARRHQLDARRDAEPRAQPLPHARGERGAGRVGGVARRVLRAHEQLVHRLAARDDHPELAAESLDGAQGVLDGAGVDVLAAHDEHVVDAAVEAPGQARVRSEEHTSELQSLAYLVCRLLLEKKNNTQSQT